MAPPSDGSRHGSVAQSLFSFLTLLSAVSDETERARLTTTAISSLLPCRLSGVALLGETDGSWRLLLQKDGEQVASSQTEEILVDLEPLFEQAIQNPNLLNVAAAGQGECRIPSSMDALNVQRLAIAPLTTLRSKVGALFVGKRGPERWSQDDEVLLLTLAEHTAINTENHRFYESVAERTAELEAFSYTVSHDLRGPLRVIDGFSRALMEDHSEQLDAEGRRLLNVVHTNCLRMQKLIEDLLAFAHLRRQQIAPIEIDMTELAKAAFEEVKAFTQRDVEASFEALPAARGDQAMIRQVWVNLLSNAVKFTSTRQAPRVHVGYKAEQGANVYYVRDNGVGFDARYADKLFGVFERVHPSDDFEGTGVGLAIVQRIIQRHGGRVWAEGRVNDGATLYFTLAQKSSSLAAMEESG